MLPVGSVHAAGSVGSPWTTPVYGVSGALAGLGAVLFVAGLSVVRSETLYDEQVPGINLAILGTVLAGAAAVWALLSGRRAVVARRVRVLGAVPAVVERAPAAVVRPAVTPAASSVRSAALVAGEGLVHFHRADCVMAAGRAWPAGDRDEHERAGRIACGVCRP